MNLSVIVTFHNPLAGLAMPFYQRDEYPPRIVRTYNFLFFSLGVVDHGQVKTSPVPAGYEEIVAGDVRAGDLVLDGRNGCWRIASEKQVGNDAAKFLGIARRVVES